MPSNNQMKAVQTAGFGEADVLQLKDMDRPALKADELLIETIASGLNAADLLQRRGLYPAPKGSSEILGLEASGNVLELGPGAEKFGFRLGDRVMTLLSGGGYASHIAVRADQLMKLPDGMNDVEAAGIPEAFLTAYLELIWLGNISAGQRLLIHAGASGVGTAAIQIAKAKGAEIFVTASSQEKLQFCKDLGAHHLINYRAQDFAEEIAAKTSGQGVHCILDLVGASHFVNNLKALSVEGRLLFVGMGGGAKSEIDLRLVISKRLQLIGSTLRARTLDEKARLIKEFWSDAKARFESGEYRPVINKIYSVEEVRRAHEYMESQANVGKILLKWH